MPYLLLFLGTVLGILCMYFGLIIAPILFVLVSVIIFVQFKAQFSRARWVVMLCLGLIVGTISGYKLTRLPRIQGEICEGYVVKENNRSVSIQADTCSKSAGNFGYFYVYCGNIRCPKTYDRSKFTISDTKRFGKFVGKGKCETSIRDKEKSLSAEYYNLLQIGKKVRLEYFAWLRQKLPVDQSALITSMLFGDTELSSDLIQEMKNVGVLHIVAISGINIAYLLELLAQLLQRFSRKWRTFFEVLVLLFLYIVVGVAVSLTRATIMSFWGIFRRRVGIRSAKWHFSVGLVVLLLIDAEYLFDAGFLLVGSACFGIYIGGGLVRKYLKNGMLHTVALAVVVWFCVVPAQLLLFKSVNPMGVVVGVLLSPLIEALTLFGYVGVVVRFVPMASNALTIVLGVIASVILLAIELFHTG